MEVVEDWKAKLNAHCKISLIQLEAERGKMEMWEIIQGKIKCSFLLCNWWEVETSNHW